MFFKQEVVLLALTGCIQHQKKNGEWICAGRCVDMKFLFGGVKLRVAGHDGSNDVFNAYIERWASPMLNSSDLKILHFARFNQAKRVTDTSFQ